MNCLSQLDKFFVFIYFLFFDLFEILFELALFFIEIEGDVDDVFDSKNNFEDHDYDGDICPLIEISLDDKLDVETDEISKELGVESQHFYHLKLVVTVFFVRTVLLETFLLQHPEEPYVDLGKGQKKQKRNYYQHQKSLDN